MGASVNRCRAKAWRVRGSLATAAALGLLLSGCSEIGFPNVHDMPAPRADTTLTPDEVKQATDTLISERDHLQSIPPATAPAPAPAPQKASLQPAPAAATTGTTQTAGAATQP
jgi:hypothetical protein